MSKNPVSHVTSRTALGLGKILSEKSPLKSVPLFLWNLLAFGRIKQQRHLQNPPVERSDASFYCSISKVVHFDLFCSYYIVFASHYFLAVRKHQHIQTLRDLMWKTGGFCPFSLPFPSRVRCLCACSTTLLWENIWCYINFPSSSSPPSLCYCQIAGLPTDMWSKLLHIVLYFSL